MNRIQLAEEIAQLEYELKSGAYADCSDECLAKLYNQLDELKNELKEII